MYRFGPQFRRDDPFAPDPYGLSVDRLTNPEPYLDKMQFTQNPTTPDVAPSMGIGEGGGVPSAPYMGMNAQPVQEGFGGGSNMAGGLMAASKMANAMGNEEKSIPLPGVGKAAQGSAMEFILPFAQALEELKRGRRRQ